MPFVISSIVALIASALFSGLAESFFSAQTMSFQLSIPQAIAGTLSAIAGLSCYKLLTLRQAPPENGSNTSRNGSHGQLHGKVKWFNPKKGFGFITAENGDEVFVHYKSIEGDGRKILREGQSVRFVIVQSEKGPQAEKVHAQDN